MGVMLIQSAIAYTSRCAKNEISIPTGDRDNPRIFLKCSQKAIYSHFDGTPQAQKTPMLASGV